MTIIVTIRNNSDNNSDYYEAIKNNSDNNSFIPPLAHFFFSFRAEVLQPAAEAPVISAVPPLRSSESLSNTLWFHWCGFKDDGSIFHFIYGIYMGYIILSSCHPIDELHHFSRWAHCTSNQFAELGIDLLVLNAGNSRE